jgi:hypothetical protein
LSLPPFFTLIIFCPALLTCFMSISNLLVPAFAS